MENQPSRTPRLRAVPGQRRSSPRSAGFTAVPVKVMLHGAAAPCAAMLEAIDYGKVVLRASGQGWDEGARIESIQEEGGDELLDGNWRVGRVRPDGDSVVVSAEHPYAGLLQDLDAFVTPQTFLRTNQHRVFHLESAADVASVSGFFTDVKDCPLPVPGHIRDGETRIPFQFDFSSGRKSLETIDLKADAKAAKDLKPKSRWMVDFSFLSVRYLMPVVVRGYDADWELAEVSMEGMLLAVTNRIHDRHACRIPVTIEGERPSETYAGIIREINGEGGLVAADGAADFERLVGREFTFRALPSGDGFRVVGVRKTKDRLAFLFVKGGVERIRPLSNLIFSHLDGPLVGRKPESYDEFLKLYEAVGYAPKDPASTNAWEAETKRTWAQVDEVLPNGCLGYRSPDGGIACSMGTLPWGPEMVYGHSFAMVRDIHGAIGTFDQMVLSFAWMEILPNIKRYAGAVATTSRWTVRLQSNFEHSGAPRSQWLVHVMLCYFNEAGELSGGRDHEILPVGADSLNAATKSQPLHSLISSLSKQSPVVGRLHHVECYLVHRTGGAHPIGVVIKNHSPAGYTAVDVFRRTWIFDWEGNMNVGAVAAAIARDTKGLPGPIAYVKQDGSKSPTETKIEVRTIPVLWMFTSKSDVGVVTASIARAAYHIYRKYAESGAAEVRRLLFQ